MENRELFNLFMKDAPTEHIERQLSWWIDKKLHADHYIAKFSAELERRKNGTEESQ